MRRMLDPKEVGGGGGGGDEKLYCHCIKFYNSNNKGGLIVINYYSKKKDKYTYNTINKEFDINKKFACNGYIHIGNDYYPAIYIVQSSNDINAYYYYKDTDRYIFDFQNLNAFQFTDNVYEVI